MEFAEEIDPLHESRMSARINLDVIERVLRRKQGAGEDVADIEHAHAVFKEHYVRLMGCHDRVIGLVAYGARTLEGAGAYHLIFEVWFEPDNCVTVKLCGSNPTAMEDAFYEQLQEAIGYTWEDWRTPRDWLLTQPHAGIRWQRG